MPSSARRSSTRSAGMPTRCGAAPSRRRSTPTRWPRRSARRSRLKSRREHDEHGERGGERDRRRGSPPRPAVHRADADQQEAEAPGDEAEIDAPEDSVAAPVVVAAGAEEVLAVDGDPDRPEDEQRQRERRRGEREDVPCTKPRSLAPEPARSAVEQAAAEPVDRSRLARAGDEGEHWDERDRYGAVVQHAAEGRAREHDRDPRENGDREEDLLPALDRLLRLVAERREDRARGSEHEHGAHPPAAPESGRLGDLCAHAGHDSLLPWTQS